MPQCFISHSNKDRAFIEGILLKPIKEIGYTTWYSTEDIKTAAQWEESIYSGLEESEWFVLVMSQASASSKWVKKEVAWAIKNRASRIIPIMIQDFEPKQFHPELTSIETSDYRKDHKKGELQLIKSLAASMANPIRRVNGIVGNWKGKVIEVGKKGTVFPTGLEYTVEALLNVNNDEVNGKFSFALKIERNRLNFDFSMSGHFLYEHFLRLIYQSKDAGSIQFGSIIAKLSEDGKNLTGRFIGYSPQQKDIVSGSIELTKSS